MAITFRSELKHYCLFLHKPSLSPRIAGYPRKGNGLSADFKLHTPLLLMLKWLFFLWGINIFLLAPIVYMAADSLPASYLFDLKISSLVFFAVIWAPFVEEFLFRFGLRQPLLAVVVVPVFISVLLYKVSILSALLLIALCIGIFLYRHFTTPISANKIKFLRLYVRFFPIVWHLSVLMFAAIHLSNYKLSSIESLWLLPILVIPQWFSGSVLAWMRVRDSFLAGAVMHASFNGGPVLLMWLISSNTPHF